MLCRKSVLCKHAFYSIVRNSPKPCLHLRRPHLSAEIMISSRESVRVAYLADNSNHGSSHGDCGRGRGSGRGGGGGAEGGTTCGPVANP